MWLDERIRNKFPWWMKLKSFRLWTNKNWFTFQFMRVIVMTSPILGGLVFIWCNNFGVTGETGSEAYQAFPLIKFIFMSRVLLIRDRRQLDCCSAAQLFHITFLVKYPADVCHRCHNTQLIQCCYDNKHCHSKMELSNRHNLVLIEWIEWKH